ncbi:hypothetical protein [Bradyrhizobium sp.]|uniref:hypothetical protein n=1 Tax=Bradyrhizobium sp. TaxID=376 RepID=UPI003C788EAD
MSQPSVFWWQKYGTLAQVAQAPVALLGFVAILFQINEPAYLATYRTDTQEWVKTSMKTASVTPPDCKLGKT